MEAVWSTGLSGHNRLIASGSCDNACTGNDVSKEQRSSAMQALVWTCRELKRLQLPHRLRQTCEVCQGRATDWKFVDQARRQEDAN
jgi:hypothetical protein